MTTQVAWTPTEAEVRDLARAAARVVLRRSLAWLAAVCAVAGLLVMVTDGVVAAALLVGLPFLLLVGLYAAVTTRRNRRIVTAAYPVGVEARAEARDDGLLLVTAVGSTELPWSRLTRPRVRGSVVSVRDTVLRRQVVLARQLFPDEWLSRLGA